MEKIREGRYLCHTNRNWPRRAGILVAMDKHIFNKSTLRSPAVKFIASLPSSILGAVVAVAIAFSFFYLMPVSYWFDVRSVNISNSIAGVSPRMAVDRTINRPFRADWRITVLKQIDSGWTSVCTAPGSNDYGPDARLPPDLDLDWWTFPTECNLVPGTYTVRTLWEVKVLGFLSKDIRILSNIFTVE